MNLGFEITKEELLDAAAKRVADMCIGEYEDLYQSVSQIVEGRINDAINKAASNGLQAVVEERLDKELSGLIEREFIPVDMWGEPKGEAVNIRSELEEQAKRFWTENVKWDSSKERWISDTGVYGARTPRHEAVVKQILGEEVSKAVRENIDGIIDAFRASLKASISTDAAEHIDQIIRAKR